MDILLDTHAFLWFVFGDSKLSDISKTEIENLENSIHLSLASIWEMSIKHGLGKLPVTLPFKEFILDQTVANSIKLASIQPEHLFELLNLPKFHKDPFERLLAAHCRVNGFLLVSADSVFDAYSVNRIWE